MASKIPLQAVFQSRTRSRSSKIIPVSTLTYKGKLYITWFNATKTKIILKKIKQQNRLCLKLSIFFIHIREFLDFLTFSSGSSNKKMTGSGSVFRLTLPLQPAYLSIAYMYIWSWRTVFSGFYVWCLMPGERKSCSCPSPREIIMSQRNQSSLATW